MTSANFLIIAIVAMAVGAVTGLVLDGFVSDLYLAIIAGFLATVVAAIVRNLIMVRGSGAGPDESKIPMVVIVFAAVASLAGSAAAVEVATRSGVSSSVWIGALAGLFSGLLKCMLTVTYFMTPRASASRKR